MKNWISNYGAGTFRSWDFYVSVACGGLAAVVAAASDGVRDAAVPVLITEAAVGVAVTSTIFAAMAIVSTFYDGAYRRVLELAGGFRSALMPYIVVGVVAASAGVVAIVGALSLPALGAWLVAAVVGVATWLCSWTLTGTVSIIELTLFHATERARLMSGADDAEAIRARRLEERREHAVPPH